MKKRYNKNRATDLLNVMPGIQANLNQLISGHLLLPWLTKRVWEYRVNQRYPTIPRGWLPSLEVVYIEQNFSTMCTFRCKEKPTFLIYKVIWLK